MKAKFPALSLLLLCAMLSPAAEPCEAKGGGKAASHMSAKGSANNNAQWSADPSRGWVRAEERHEMRSQNAPRKASGPAAKAKAKSKSY